MPLRGNGSRKVRARLLNKRTSYAGSGFMNLSGFKTQDNAWAKLLERGAGSKGGEGGRELDSVTNEFSRVSMI